MEGNLNNWTHQALNFPSRLTLIKTVLHDVVLRVFNISHLKGCY